MWRRKDKLLIVSASVVDGAVCDEQGVWGGQVGVRFGGGGLLGPVGPGRGLGWDWAWRIWRPAAG